LDGLYIQNGRGLLRQDYSWVISGFPEMRPGPAGRWEVGAARPLAQARRGRNNGCMTGQCRRRGQWR
jgi:hypothetical protein